jgi:hypothetical protein
LLFVGDDWAEAHHDGEVMDAAGRRLAKARLGEGVVGMARLHAMIGEQLSEDAEATEVLVGTETDRRGVGSGVDRGAGTRCMRSTHCRWPATGNGIASRGPQATPLTRTPWLRGCAPISTSCVRWPRTAPRPGR